MFSASAYLTGKVVRVDSTQTTSASDYAIYIECAGQIYTAHLAEQPGYRVEWGINSPVEFRLGKESIYLRDAHGNEIKAVLEQPPPQPKPGNTTESPASNTGSFRVPRCAEIAAMGSEYAPLGSACEYALSPRICPISSAGKQ